MSLPNLDKLLKKATDLGLVVTPKGKKLGKNDCVQALRTHFLPPGGLPYEEVTPMLCFAEWNLKDEERKEIYEAPAWVMQKKLNGCRLVLHFVKGVGIFAHSRTISVKTFRFEELTDHLLINTYKPNFSATVDCEIMIEKSIDTTGYTVSGKGEKTKTSLHSTTAVLHLKAEAARRLQVDQDAAFVFHVFDVMKLDGTDLRNVKLRDRLKHLEATKVRILLSEIGKQFIFPEVVATDRRAYVEKLIEEGWEGGIAKHLDSVYEDNSSRSRLGWVKIKKRLEYDAFVSGFIRGTEDTGWQNLIGALEFSVHLKEGGTHVIGYASNLTLENRQKLTVYHEETGKVSLLPAAYGKVAEISGQDISAREFRLSHCTIDRWRPKDGPDAKRSADCIQSMEDLKDAAEWVG